MTFNQAGRSLEYYVDPEIQGLIKCHACPKTFVKRGQYNRHNKTHTRPYRCDSCEKRFAVNGDLIRHKKIHQGADARFYCKWPQCTFGGASRKDNLRRHMREAHEEALREEQGNFPSDFQRIYKKSVLEQKSTMDDSSLLLGASSGKTLMIKLLLEQGADLGKKFDIGRTALHVAARNGHEDSVRALLDAGANDQALDDNGN
ncbi:hypothetical protein K469DRAFT_683976 [Zopfia rhizophila CBS 207.26]|uniref:C2H2-type domain-containing protein n=1 Tax=Zopfia rhizophila CBS 207.26 TaxID=1314779 RepID=A0A6A6D7I2_9PEZI|nr:hypothetical protein K469DRAFT_683976 [Zopfia rhizophila CBS 207.26]